jgi:hypothetical protein
MRTFRFHIQEFLITVAFVGVVMYVFVSVWNQGGFVYLPGIVSFIIVVPFLYFLSLLMIRQRRERRKKLTKESFTAWDEL